MYRLLAFVACAGCAVRAPARIDVAALLAKRGPIEAHRQLAERIVADPRDVQARLALADLDRKLGRPGEELDELDFVYKLSGPLGVRWHAEDRERYAQLLADRAHVRFDRSSGSSLADLERARELGAKVSNDEIVRARQFVAWQELLHVDPDVRARGRAIIASLGEEPFFRGARPNATPADRAAYAGYAEALGAYREAFEAITAWHDATKPPRDAHAQGLYLLMLAWWLPPNEMPPPGELVGDARCLFDPDGCPTPAEPEWRIDDWPGDKDLFAVAVALYAFGYHDPGRGSPERQPRLYDIAVAYRRDPAIAERLGRERVAATVDTAVAHAELGRLFEALADPARSRVEWQAAVDASPDPEFLLGLALAVARAGDGAAALVFATRAAAASGDPAGVWISVANALEETGLHVDGMTAARSAMELAGRRSMPRALDVAIEASKSLGRTTQADALEAQRLHFAPRPEDLVEALAEHRRHPTAATVARLWVVSRAHLLDVDSRAAIYAATGASDPRHHIIGGELARISLLDRDAGFAAVRALAH